MLQFVIFLCEYPTIEYILNGLHRYSRTNLQRDQDGLKFRHRIISVWGTCLKNYLFKNLNCTNFEITMQKS